MLRFALALGLVGLAWLTPSLPVHAQAAPRPCGFVNQQPCWTALPAQGTNPAQQTNPPNVPIPINGHCQPHATPQTLPKNSVLCVLNAAGWTSYNAKISQAQDLDTLGIVPTADLNCPLFPQCYIVPTAGTTIPAGRYMYVLKSTDTVHPLVLRRFDRPDNPVPPCPGYRAFDTPDNYRMAGGIAWNIYQYVRHPQLNGGYDNVLASGELLVQPDNVVTAISNASGHFRPDATSLTQMKNALYALGIQVSGDLQLIDQGQGQLIPAETCGATMPQTSPQFGVRIENHSAVTMDLLLPIDSANASYPVWYDANNEVVTNQFYYTAPRYWHSDTIFAVTPKSAWPLAHAPTVAEQPYSSFFIAIPLFPSKVPFASSTVQLQLYSFAPIDRWGLPRKLSAVIVRQEDASAAGHFYCLTTDTNGPVPVVTVSHFTTGTTPPDNLPFPSTCAQTVTL